MLKSRAIKLFKEFPEVNDISMDVKKYPRWAAEGGGSCMYTTLEIEGKTRWIWFHREKETS